MATTRKTKAAIGTMQWIQSETEQAEAFIQQEVEEFEYSVRNDLEWLNEHMAEVLSEGGVYVMGIRLDARLCGDAC